MKSISTNGAGPTDTCVKNNEIAPLYHTKYEGIIDPNVRAKTVKLLEGNIGVCLCDLGIG